MQTKQWYYHTVLILVKWQQSFQRLTFWNKKKIFQNKMINTTNAEWKINNLIKIQKLFLNVSSIWKVSCSLQLIMNCTNTLCSAQTVLFSLSAVSVVSFITLHRLCSFFKGWGQTFLCLHLHSALFPPAVREPIRTHTFFWGQNRSAESHGSGELFAYFDHKYLGAWFIL